MPSTWRDLLEELAPAFSRRSTHQLFITLACGMILADRSTVVAMAAAAGLAERWRRACWFFSGAVWDIDALGLAIARLIVKYLIADGGPLVVAVDGTFFKRWGRKVFQARWAYDGSAQGGKKIAFGNTWVIAAIVVKLPGQWADGQLLRVLHGRAKAVAATLDSVAAKTRSSPRTRHLDLTNIDKAVTYLTNNHQHMRYDKALAAGWPIATGMIEGACRFVIEDRFGITGARWSPGGADVILKLRAVVVNGDLDDYMTYYKQRYRDDIHLTRYHPDSIPDLGLTA